MRSVFYALMAACAILSAVCMILTALFPNRFSKTIFKVHIAISVAVVLYFIFTIVKNYSAAVIIYSLYSFVVPYILFNVILLVSDLQLFSSLNAFVKKYAKLFWLVWIADFIFLFTNFKFFHVFRCSQITLNNVMVGWHPVYLWGYYIHLGLCYVEVAIILATLINGLVKSARLYKRGYINLLITFSLCVILNGISMGLRFIYDISACVYVIFATVYCYCALFGIKNALVRKMITVVSDNIRTGVICFDIYGKCIYKNESAEVIFKGSQASYKSPEDFRIKIINNNGNEPHFLAVNEKILIDGNEHFFSILYQEICDKKNRLQGSFLKLDDRTAEIKRLEEEIYKGSHDPVTGLLNRKAFFENVSAEIAKNPLEPRYMIATDIENFKLINDLFGTKIGDEILRTQADMLLNANYEGVVQGRISGDRFAMLIPKKYFNQKMAIINTRKIQEIVPLGSYKLHLYLGQYEITDPDEDVQLMYDKAALAIQEIHGSYELTFATFDGAVRSKQIYEKTILNGFEEGLEKEQFVMFLQPHVEAKTDSVIGAEALVRWNHPEYGLIDPQNFLYILEKTEAIFKMDNFIWEQAARRLSIWKSKGLENIYLTVNISIKDFYYGDLYKIFSGLVTRYDINPKNLKLEITETVLMSDLRHHKKVISDLRAYGFEIAMDDFGSGYSSLRTLKDIPMDILKIDMRFMSNYQDDFNKRPLLKLIIDMAKCLNMNIIFEGVETENHVTSLEKLGCDIFQGFYFSKPITISVFEMKYLKRL